MTQTPAGIPSSPLPPVSAEYKTAMQSLPGKRPQVHGWKMFRSAGGAMHLDFGKTGLITKPGAKGALLLDHVKREARIVPPAPVQAVAPPATAPGGATPHTPKPPSLPKVKDLGKRIIGGHQAEGKMYTFHPPKAPGLPQPAGKAPAGPKMPALPGLVPAGAGAAALGKLPAVPKMPAMPGNAPGGGQTPAMAKPPIPGAPQAKVQKLEVWTHTQLKVPLLTKASGVSGLQSSVCKNAKGGEPPASLFRIPPGYKLVEPKPPARPPSPA
jgi:hypothetical protein